MVSFFTTGFLLHVALFRLGITHDCAIGEAGPSIWSRLPASHPTEVPMRRIGLAVISVMARVVALPLLLILVGGCATAEDLTAEDLTFLPSSAAEEAWEALVKGGHVALIRHGNAPPGYGGDPPGFRFDDCKTQRNMDDVGREQAKSLGEAFRKHGVRVDRIVASPVCRCQETAQLMAVGSIETSWALIPDRGPGTNRLE